MGVWERGDTIVVIVALHGKKSMNDTLVVCHFLHGLELSKDKDQLC